MLCVCTTIPVSRRADLNAPMSLCCDTGINKMRCFYVKKRRKDSRYRG